MRPRLATGLPLSVDSLRSSVVSLIMTTGREIRNGPILRHPAGPGVPRRRDDWLPRSDIVGEFIAATYERGELVSVRTP